MYLAKEQITYQTTFIGDGTVTSHQNVSGNRLPENLNTENICNKLLGFLLAQIKQHDKKV